MQPKADVASARLLASLLARLLAQLQIRSAKIASSKYLTRKNLKNGLLCCGSPFFVVDKDGGS